MEASVVERVLSDVDHLVLILGKLPDRAAVEAAALVSTFWAAQSRDERVWHALYMNRWGDHFVVEPNLHELAAADLAVFTGLVARPDLNGKVARLVKWIEQDGRWVAATASAGPSYLISHIKVRPKNLTGTWRWRWIEREHTCKRHEIETSRSVGHFDSFSSREPRPLAAGLHRSSRINISGAHAWFRNTKAVLSDMADSPHETCRSIQPLWPLANQIGYYEVKVTGASVGVTNGNQYGGSSFGIHVGWRRTAYGYHSDDGSKWRNDERGRPESDGLVIQGERFAEPFGNTSRTDSAATLDVVGCGVDYARRSIFFTKNGRLMGTAFEDVPAIDHVFGIPAHDDHRANDHIERPLYPTVTLHTRDDVCKFNFGAEPFLFDVLAFGRSEARNAAVVGGGRSNGVPPS